MDPRKLIKAEMAKRGIEKTKRMAAPVLSKMKKTEAFVHHQLETPLWHYGVRIALVLLIILIKRIPDAWVMMSKNMVARILIAAVIVYLAYIDVFSAALMAVAFVLLLQHDDKGPSNTRSYMWFGFGETWHKNHHDDPSLTDHSLGKGVDWTYEICRILSKSKKST